MNSYIFLRNSSLIMFEKSVLSSSTHSTQGRFSLIPLHLGQLLLPPRAEMDEPYLYEFLPTESLERIEGRRGDSSIYDMTGGSKIFV